eukprot:1271971-Amorphochlora_amoeboformis.AAC.1
MGLACEFDVTHIYRRVQIVLQPVLLFQQRVHGLLFPAGLGIRYLIRHGRGGPLGGPAFPRNGARQYSFVVYTLVSQWFKAKLKLS